MKNNVKPPGFFYKKLSQKEKAVFDTIYDGLRRREHRFRVATTGVDIHKVIEAICDDCPEIYFVSEWNMLYTENEIWFQSQSPYLYSSDTCEGFDSRLQEIADRFRIYDNDFDKELAIHNYLIENVRFDHNEVNGHRQRRTENHSIIGPLLWGTGVCEGIAKACQYLLQQLYIECALVKGESWSFTGDIPVGHAWNIVKIRDQYYHLDTSHDVCLSKKSAVPYYHYFNLTDKEILRDHNFSPHKYSDISCQSTVDNYYKKYKMYFESESQLISAIERIMNTPLLPRGYKCISFKVSQDFPEDERIFQIINRCLSRYNYTISATVAELQRAYSITINIKNKGEKTCSRKTFTS